MTCQCPEGPYIGTQPLGEAVRCERCGKPVRATEDDWRARRDALIARHGVPEYIGQRSASVALYRHKDEAAAQEFAAADAALFGHTVTVERDHLGWLTAVDYSGWLAHVVAEGEAERSMYSPGRPVETVALPGDNPPSEQDLNRARHPERPDSHYRRRPWEDS